MGGGRACYWGVIEPSTALCHDQTTGTVPLGRVMRLTSPVSPRRSPPSPFALSSLCVLPHRSVCCGAHIKRGSVFTQCSSVDCSGSGTVVRAGWCSHLRPTFHCHCGHVLICYDSTRIAVEFSISWFYYFSSPQCVGDFTSSAVLLGRDGSKRRGNGGVTGAGLPLILLPKAPGMLTPALPSVDTP